MADEAVETEGSLADQSEASELILSPSPERPIVADTASPAIDDNSVSASQFISSEALQAKGLSYLRHKSETRVHRGPLPDPETLRDLAEILPNAPKIIFEEFRAQSNHRREMERAVVMGNIKAMHRGQIIGGLIGAAGVVGSLIIAGMGYGWAGFGIATSSLVGLVSVFVRGRQAQEKERLEKEKLRGSIARGEPVENLEDKHPPDRTDESSSPQRMT